MPPDPLTPRFGQARPARVPILLACLVLTAMAGAGLAGGAVAAKPKLKKCNIGTTRPVRCGHIMVPTVRGVPKAGKEKIGFAVRPRGDRSTPSRGTIIFTEGGPGFAATNFDSARPAAALFKPFLKHRELVFFDQRGTGHSNPVRCEGLQRGTQPFNEAVRSCFDQMGPRARGMTTANSAADIKALIDRMDLKLSLIHI